MNRPIHLSAETQSSDAAKSATVIALHCSGSNAGQWRALAEALGAGYDLQTPEHQGTEIVTERRDGQPFTLTEEAARTLEIIDRSNAPVHLIGHSYGGAVALHAALARPGKIASLLLYEPTAFYLLPQIGRAGRAACAEITAMAGEVRNNLSAGEPCSAMSVFIDYWGGPGAWAALRPNHKAALCAWAPKVLLEFEAAMQDPTGLAAYQALKMPTLILRGEFAPMPTRVIATALSQALPNSRLTDLIGAGHMGPITHTAAVQMAILGHIAASETAALCEGRVAQRKLGWPEQAGAYLAANLPVRGAA